MKRFRKNDGFTLVEILVTFLAGSIVMLSATTVLLLGIRIMNKSTDTAEQQYTTRVLLTAMEDIAAEGTITEVRSETGPNPENNSQEVTLSWQVLNGTKVVFSFDRANQTIYTGAQSDGAPMLTGVVESSVDIVGKVLTFSVTTDTGTYDTSINCRLMPDNYRGDTTGTSLIDRLTDGDSSNDTVLPDASNENIGRNEFLKVLASQYGSRGYVMDDAGRTDTYYSEWYLNKLNNTGYEDNPQWNENTPWCACYVSWALAQSRVVSHIGVTACPLYANVNDFKGYFAEKSLWETADAYTPIPGDLIFFNTDADEEPDHLGVVLAIQGGKVYTIEGNSYNRVRVRDYEVLDSDNGIIGYGILPWLG